MISTHCPEAGLLIQRNSCSKRAYFFAALAIFFLILKPSISFADTPVPGGNITSNTTWTLAGSPYIVQGNVTVNSGVTLTIEPGVTVKFNGYYELVINGTLNAQGNAGARIIFTSNNPSPAANNWKHILFNGAGSSTSVIEYWTVEYSQYGIVFNQSSPNVTQIIASNNSAAFTFAHSNVSVSYAVASNNGTGFSITDGSVVTITNSTIINNGIGIGLYNLSIATPFATVNHCSIYNNSNWNVFMGGPFGFSNADGSLNFENNWWGTVSASQIDSRIWDHNEFPNLPYVDFVPFLDGENGNPVPGTWIGGGIPTSTWTPSENPYVIYKNLTVPSGAVLTINPGVIVKFDGYFTFTINGRVIANGTSGQLITFTSNQASPQAGNWNKIFFNGSESTNSQASYWLVQYGNDGVALSNSSPALSHIIVSNQSSVGFNISHGASPTITYSTARNVGGYGVWIGHDGVADPHPVFNYCNFYNNGLYNVAFSSYFDSNAVLDFKNNWWGTTDINQITAKILDHNDVPPFPTVDFIPFLDSEDGEPILYVHGASRSPAVINHVLGQTVSVGYRLSIDATVTLRIYGELNDNLIRTLIMDQPRTAGQNFEVWDGRDDEEELVPYEAYYFDVEATAGTQTYHYIDSIGGSPSPGEFGAVVTNPDFNPYQNETVTISYTVPNAGRQPVNVLSNINQFLRQIVDDRPKPAGFRVDRWDGRQTNGQIFTGSYHFQFPQSIRLRKNTIILQSSRTPASEIAANPFFLFPVQGEISTLAYQLNEDAVATVSIRDPLGNHFRTLLNQVSQNAGQQTVIWDGKDDLGEYPSVGGDYEIVVETSDLQMGETLQASGSIVVAL